MLLYSNSFFSYRIIILSGMDGVGGNNRELLFLFSLFIMKVYRGVNNTSGS